MRRVRILLSLALLTIAAGCTASSAAEQPAASISGPLTDAELDRLFDAEQLLTRDCARKAGFSYWPLVRRPVPELRDFPYGVDDVDWAKRYGYGLGLEAKFREISANHPNQKYLDTLPAGRRQQFAAVLNGPAPIGLEARDADGRRVTHSDQGCVSEAQRKLYGDLPGWYRATRATSGLARIRADRILSDRSFAPLVSAWSGCMKQAGFDFKAPVESARIMSRRTGVPAAVEIRTAVAEAECLRTSGLGAAARAADERISTEQQQQFGPQLDAEQRLQRAALPTAAEVVSRG